MTSTSVTSRKYVMTIVLVALIMLLILATLSCEKKAQAPPLSIEALQAIAAPMALYPDDMLAHVLVASTVPDEVAQAALYLKDNNGKVTGMPATDWDPSVKALLYFPDVLNRMNDNLTWTQTLGNAVVNQQQDVMNAIQVYRNEVYRAGNLRTNSYQKIVYDNNAVEIMPVAANKYYVPVYNPSSITNSGNPLTDFLYGTLVGDWWNYRSTNWGNQNIVENPTYFGYYNNPVGGYYSGLWSNEDLNGAYNNGAYINSAYNVFNTGTSAWAPPLYAWAPAIYTWTPTQRAHGFFRYGIINNNNIIYTAKTKFKYFKNYNRTPAILAGTLPLGAGTINLLGTQTQYGTITVKNGVRTLPGNIPGNHGILGHGNGIVNPGNIARPHGTIQPKINSGAYHSQNSNGAIKQQSGNGGAHSQNYNGAIRQQSGNGGAHSQNSNGAIKQQSGNGGAHSQNSNGAIYQQSGNGGAHSQNSNGAIYQQSGNGGSHSQNSSGAIKQQSGNGGAHSQINSGSSSPQVNMGGGSHAQADNGKKAKNH